MLSTVLIIPAIHVQSGNSLAELMGWGPNNYSIPLSKDGFEPATHYGLHAWTSNEFKAWIEGTLPLPEGMEFAQNVIDVLIASFQLDIKDHWQNVITANDLQTMEFVK